MAKIHMILQGKGGVGKSFIATMLAQHKLAKGQNPLCVDTDPVNATFSGFNKLNVKQLKLMEGDEINPRKFDDLIELIATSESDVIIDNGASTFVPLSHYLISNNVPALLLGMGHELVVHTVITGSQALLDTLNGFAQLVSQFPSEALFTVWLNPFWGPIEMNGKDFEQMKAYLDNKARVSAIIRIPQYKVDTFGRDISDILQKRLTFDEAIQEKSLTLMMRQRIKIVKQQVFVQLENAAAVLA
jgi:CobQ/CobB/MinD/ParA nucleotide binding domain